ncbi:MAG: DUF488 domain-containing protein [Pseudonocardiales bacterium]|nr:DUF488 domain-containing protein [Pseudonocardiales bacterium]
MKVYTIGFTKKSAKRFFESLREVEVRRVVDVRLNNVSQLSGFAKKDDLAYFLKVICDMDYIHLPVLAPTQELLGEYKKRGSGWAFYEAEFLNLMARRAIEKNISREVIEDGCLLCSEDKSYHCHRRLVVEYLQRHWGQFTICHL